MSTKTQQTMAAYVADHLDEIRGLTEQHAADAAYEVERALFESVSLGEPSRFWFDRLAEKFSAAVREYASDNGVEITDGM